MELFTPHTGDRACARLSSRALADVAGGRASISLRVNRGVDPQTDRDTIARRRETDQDLVAGETTV